MDAIEVDTKFARVSLWWTGLEGIRRGPENVPAPDAPHRIDWCVLDTLCFKVEVEAVFEVGLKVEPKAGWLSWQEGGEYFDCVLFEHTEGHQACVGLRDYEWFEQRYGLKCLESAQHPVPFRAKFKATRSAPIEIEMSLAMTTSPVTDAEGISPWLVTDRALTF